MNRSDIPFIEVFVPWLDGVHLELSARAGDRLHWLTPHAVASLELNILQRWSQLCTQSFFHEMQIDRIEHPFRGGSSRERYLDLIHRKWLAPQALATFWNEYPKLQQLVQLYATFWVDAIVELLDRLDRDSLLLSHLFCDDQPLGKVVDLQMGLGDFHHQGRSVCLLIFEGGKSLFYKPKHLDVTQQFNLFLQELTALGMTPALQGYRVCPRGEYGWEEKVESLVCHDVQAVERYFQRAGVLLCLLYLLDGTDLHYENVIASGEFPMLIDLDTLFHTRLSCVDVREEEKRLHRSVLEIGLLPLFLFQRGYEKGLDFSGLGEETELTSSQKKWGHLHTDAMTLIDERTVRARSLHRVYLGSERVRARDFIESIVSGFNRMYGFLQNHPSWVHHAMERMRSVRVRIILRETQFYASILQRLNEIAFEPEGVERTLSLLDQPFQHRNSFPESVVAAERKALLQGDIPYFYMTPFSTDLFSDERCIEPHCLVPFLQKELHEADRAVQESFIRQAFFMQNANVHIEAPAVCVEPVLLTDIPSSSEWLAQAIQVAQELQRRAIVSPDGTLGWLHLDPYLTTEQYQISSTSLCLYSGRAGMALFFAALGHVTQDPQWNTLARLCTEPLLQQIETRSRSLIFANGIGGVSGMGGVVYGLLHIGNYLQMPSYIQAAMTLLQSIEAVHIEEDDCYDVMAGSAGLCLAALAVYHHTAESQALEQAILCGNSLVSRARRMDNGLYAWGKGTKPMLGFSHGTAGIAYALHQLAHITQDRSYAQVAEKAIDYERFHFSQEEKNWPRFQGAQTLYSCAWCHGATGVGLSRLALLPIVKQDEQCILQEVRDALATTYAHVPTSRMKLCCGLLGHIEFLRAAEAHCIESRAWAQQGLRHLYRGLQESSSTEFYNPGLMQGTAGVGYTLLRLVDHTLPQVLLLGS